jgi:hypothetical protein
MPRQRRKHVVEFRLRLYRGQDDELIDWLEQFDERPYGVKTQAVKETLQRGIEGAPNPGTAPAIDLAELRRVVEAAVAAALSRFEGRIAGTPVATPEEDDETEDLLDALGAALVLADDEA